MANPPTVSDYVNQALDAEFQRTAGPMLLKVEQMTNSPSSQMQKDLEKLDAEATQAMENDVPLRNDNEALQSALETYANVLLTVAGLVASTAPKIQGSGQRVAVPAVTAKVFLGVTGDIIKRGIDPTSSQAAKIFKTQISKIGGKWKLPKDPSDFAAGFIDTDAWIGKMEKWGEGYASLTRRSILDGISQGQSPRVVADMMRTHAQGIPYNAAENLTRTLQLTSYREASLAMEELNGKFIIGKIRIATLDTRTCCSCIALHGTPLKPGQRVDDHYRGRCTEFYQVPGGDEFPQSMQADSTPGNRRFVPFQKGEDWFKSLPPERQARQASFRSTPAKFKAYQSGVPLSDFVGDHTDDVFGHQIIENSLKGMGLEKYYVTTPKAPVPPKVSSIPSPAVGNRVDNLITRVSGLNVEDPDLAVHAVRSGIRKEVLSLPPTDGRNEMLSAIKNAQEDVLIYRAPDGSIGGVVSFSIGDELKIVDMGSVVKGAGTAMTDNLKEMASNLGIPLRADARINARSFWEHMGFVLKPGTTNVYIWVP